MVEVKQSIFHGGQAYLERLDEIQQSLDIITVKREVETDRGALLRLWLQNYSLLNAFYKEIYPKMDKKQKVSHKEAAKTLKRYVNKAKMDLLKGNSLDLRFLEMFDEWELKLKEIVEAKGLQMPDKESMISATEV